MSLSSITTPFSFSSLTIEMSSLVVSFFKIRNVFSGYHVFWLGLYEDQ